MYETILKNLVRIGTVTATAPASHTHGLVIRPWMPKVNATVLCLYLPVFNADGFILGELGPLGKLRQWADQ